MPGATDALRRVGSLVEGPAFHPYLSGGANLARLDAADRLPIPLRPADALPRWTGSGLLAAAGKRYRAYSLGMRQRLAIASALLAPGTCWCWTSRPTDSIRREPVRSRLISGLAADGTTVLLSSHLLSEVEQICDHVGVMYHGQLVSQVPLATCGGR